MDQTMQLKAPPLLNARAFDRPQWSFRYPPLVEYRFGFTPNLRRLTELRAPTEVLQGAPVEAPYGVWVGRIRSVTKDALGTPVRVEIALNRRVAVFVKPGSLRFDPLRHIAFTDIARATLWNLPSARLIGVQ